MMQADASKTLGPGWRLYCWSLDHHAAGSGLREQVAMSGHESRQLAGHLVNGPGPVREAVVVSTCNRLELYVVVEGEVAFDGPGVIGSWRAGVGDQVAALGRLISGRAVVEHLLGLCVGLESMVLGETEIFGQVKRAYAGALTVDATGKVLNLLFQRAFAVGKQLRRTQPVMRYNLSVASVAVDAVEHRHGDWSSLRCGVWGTGVVGRSVVRCLVNKGVSDGVVISRDSDRGSDAARPWSGRTIVPDDLAQTLSDLDVLFCCTGAPHVVLTRAMLPASGIARPLLVVDLALPRDVEPTIGQCPGVTLVDLDSLSAVLADSERLRVDLQSAVGPEIGRESKAFWACLAARCADQCLVRWRADVTDALGSELAALFEANPQLDAVQRQLLSRLGERLLNRMLHRPSAIIHNAVASDLPCAQLMIALESLDDA